MCRNMVCRVALTVVLAIGGSLSSAASDAFSHSTDTLSVSTDTLSTSAVNLSAMEGQSAIPADQVLELNIDLQIYFRQNVVAVEPDYKDNELRLSEFVRKINQAIADSSYRVQDIVIRSSASPEGSYAHNLWLSENRGQSLMKALQARLPIADSCFIIDAIGEDWEGLRSMVQLYDLQRKQELLDIIDGYLADTTSQPRRSTLCKLAIEKLDNGKVWDYLYGNIFPYLRSASNSVVCHLVPVHSVTASDEQLLPSRTDTIYVMSPYPVHDPSTESVGRRRNSRGRRSGGYRFALKSNLLFDAALCPNVELEFPLGKRLSLMAEHSFPWYTYDNDHYAYQLVMSGAELRFWLGDRTDRKVLTGWFTGLYGSYGYGDFEWDSKGCQCRGMWHAGLSAGYSFPLGKRDNWRLETSLAVGYAPVCYDYYERSDYYGLLIYQHSGETVWIGPTKLKCSLVWMIPGNKKTDSNNTDSKQKKK